MIQITMALFRNNRVGFRRIINDIVALSIRYSSTTDADREFRVSYMAGDDLGIALFHMNRPHRKNALGIRLVDEFVESLEAVKYNNNIRALIMKSDVPGIYCAGADLKERKEMTPERLKKWSLTIRRASEELANLPFPTIAAIDGPAIGGGLELSLACDMRVASRNSKMGLVETTLAIIPGAGGTQRLPRLVGPSIAKELIFTGRIIDSDTALEMGILNYVADQNEQGDGGYQRALELAREIIPNGPVALRMAKTAINKGLDVSIDSGLRFEELCYMQIMPTKDRIEGLLAFKEKRKPKYKGE